MNPHSGVGQRGHLPVETMSTSGDGGHNVERSGKHAERTQRYRRKEDRRGNHEEKKENGTGKAAAEEVKSGEEKKNTADTRMSNAEEASSKKDEVAQRNAPRRGNQHNNSNRGARRRDMTTAGATEKRKDRGPSKVPQQCDELTMLSYNVRGLNTESKQQKVYEVLRLHKPHLVCLNETKL